MKRILAYFQLFCDTDALTPEELTALCQENLDLHSLAQFPGCYDEAALNTALVLQKQAVQNGEDAYVDAITIGSCSQAFAQNLMAVGFRRVVQIPRESQELFPSPEESAAWLQNYIQSVGGYDAILVPKQSSPEESPMLSYLLGEKLFLPCISHVLHLEWQDTNLVSVCQTDVGTCKQTIAGPCILVIGDARYPYLPIATLRERLAVSSQTFQVFPSSSLTKDCISPPCLGLFYQPIQRVCTMVPGDTLEEQMKWVWSRYWKGKTL